MSMFGELGSRLRLSGNLRKMVPESGPEISRRKPPPPPVSSPDLG